MPSHVTDLTFVYIPSLKRCWDACQSLAQFIPGIWETIESPDLSSKKLGLYYASLDAGAIAARSDDVGRISSAVAHWLNTEFKPTPSPLLVLKKRHDRGPQHDLCGMLLCPIRHDWDDQEVRANIRGMQKGYALGSHPRVLFYNYRGDPKDIEKGYLQSRLLVKVYLHVFTAPASADAVDAYASDLDDVPPPSIRRRTDTGSVSPGSSDGDEGSNRSVAKGLSMNGKVTPRSIAYAALLLLFSLSSAGRWRTAENGMNFPRIYYAIVDYFDVDPDDEESQAVVNSLLAWWNQQIFPDHAPSGTTEVDECDDLLAKQRAERKRKAAAASSLPSSSPPPSS